METIKYDSIRGRICFLLNITNHSLLFNEFNNIKQQNRLKSYISVTGQAVFKLLFLLFYDIILKQKYYGYFKKHI